MTRREMLAATAAASALASSRVAIAGGRRLLIAVLTCPRPNGVSYLDGTLDAIDDELAGNPLRLLICDGPTSFARAGWSRSVIAPRLKKPHGAPDNKDPGFVALHLAASTGSDLLFFEDDIRPVAPGSFAAMATHRIAAGADFATFYGAGTMRAIGIHKALGFQLSQAVLLPLPTIERLVAARWRSPAAWEANTGIDLAISALASNELMHFEQTENHVHHVGYWSAAYPDKPSTY